MTGKSVRKNERSSGRGGVKSCQRTLDVIEYFIRTGMPARTFEVSASLGIPNSSADEILHTLSSGGYLSYNFETKLYAPSYKLVASVGAIERSFFGEGCVAEMLKNIHAETGATVFLTHQNDCWAEHVAEREGGWCLRREKPEYPIGMVSFADSSWRPATNFAAAMLAQKSDVAIIQLVSRAQRIGLGPKGPASMKNLVDRVARTRARGFALCRRGPSSPVDSIAIPLPIPNGTVPYAIGVVGDPLFKNDKDVRHMVAAMRSIAYNHIQSLRRMDHCI